MTWPIDGNAAFLWTIIAMGVALPILLGIYAALRLRLAKARLARMREEDRA